MHAALSRVVRTMWSMWSIMVLKIGVRPLSDDVRLLEVRNVGVAVADFGEDFGRVLAELRRLAADRARRGRELRHHARDLERLAVVRGDRFDHSAHSVMRICRAGGRAVDAPCRALGLLHASHYFRLGALSGPRAT